MGYNWQKKYDYFGCIYVLLCHFCNSTKHYNVFYITSYDYTNAKTIS